MLAQVPLFAQLPSGELDELGTRLRRRRYARGDTVFYEGDPGAFLCIVHEGRIKLSLTSPEGREIIIDLLGPGDVFGELAILDGEPRSADAVTTEPTELLLLNGTSSAASCSNARASPSSFERDEQAHAARYALLQDAAFLDVPARLARTILIRAQVGDGGTLVTPRLNQSDLAVLVGTTRETLNKWIGIFQDQGLISWDRGRVTVLDAQRLRKRVV